MAIEINDVEVTIRGSHPETSSRKMTMQRSSTTRKTTNSSKDAAVVVVAAVVDVAIAREAASMAEMAANSISKKKKAKAEAEAVVAAKGATINRTAVKVDKGP